jgi:Ketopantoate hydroxymethyltransferase
VAPCHSPALPIFSTRSIGAWLLILALSWYCRCPRLVSRCLLACRVDRLYGALCPDPSRCGAEVRATIGIGTSPACDGQILVTEDVLGLFTAIQTTLCEALHRARAADRGGRRAMRRRCAGPPLTRPRALLRHETAGGPSSLFFAVPSGILQRRTCPLPQKSLVAVNGTPARHNPALSHDRRTWTVPALLFLQRIYRR